MCLYAPTRLSQTRLSGQLNSFTERSYPESGSKNESDLHWDMLCDMSDAEIIMDGDLSYKKGRTVIQ